jgi:protein-S-isoprenylcysteine O-methyltransferase Ste14
MIAAIAVVVTVTGLYAWCAPVVANRLPPAWAVRSVVVASAVVAGALWFALWVAAGFTWIGQEPEIAKLGPWSPHVLRADSPIPQPAAVTAGIVLGVAAYAATNAVVRHAHATVHIDRDCSRVGASGSVVAPWTSPPAGFG